MPRTMIGMRIRERRRALGLKQGELAARLGISPSYLNLIERNKRGVTAHLVLAAARELGVPAEALDGASERRLAEQLDEIAADPDYRDLDLTGAEGPELVGRHPQWARALARGWGSARSARRTAAALSDRLSHDPFLSDAVHRMLTHIAAIRSTSEILESVDDIEPPQRRRFHEILSTESGRLSQVAESLAQFFDRAHEPEGPSAPGEEAEEAFAAAQNRFDALDAAASDWREACGVAPGVAGGPPLGLERALAAAARDGGMEILTEDPDDPASRLARGGSSTAPGKASTGPSGRRGALILPLGALPAERRGALAQAAAHVALGPLAAQIAATLPRLTGEAARRRAAAALEDYAADALLMPYRDAMTAGARLGWDVDALAAHFGVSFAQAARRLTSLTRKDDAAPRAAFAMVNAAGATLQRRSLPDIALPRYGAACPLWSVYRALSEPGRTLRQAAEFPDGQRVVFVARAEPAGGSGWGRLGPVRAALLALPGEAAAATVYAPPPREVAEPVGPNCRICARTGCPHRAEDPIFGA
ncbi:MAG: putative transcriptional regulator/transcriptional regulator with XRE-family HTH domain [Paracoccaceae bacterium]|jgi:predicted transcriptional regulator/transcriptional regulator with XRE-family HTH domain